MIVAGCVGIIIGMFIGRYFREPENECPLIELGYSCKWETGGECDHRESELHKARMNMALNREERQNDSNYWNGGGDES